MLICNLPSGIIGTTRISHRPSPKPFQMDPSLYYYIKFPSVSGTSQQEEHQPLDTLLTSTGGTVSEGKPQTLSVVGTLSLLFYNRNKKDIFPQQPVSIRV